MEKDFIKRLFDALGLDVQRASIIALEDPFIFQSLLCSDRSGPINLEVGAYYGVTADLYRERFPRGATDCLEPCPDSFAVLESNMQSDPNTIRASKTFSFIEINQEGNLYWNPTLVLDLSIAISSITIDDYLKHETIEQVDILKMDIQGAELLAPEGGQETHSGHRSFVIDTDLILVNPYEHTARMWELCRFLETFNYSFFGLHNLNRSQNGQLMAADAISIGPDLRKQTIAPVTQDHARPHHIRSWGVMAA